MSNDFLQSSPSRQIIDPLIYNSFPDINEDRERNGSLSKDNYASQGPSSAHKPSNASQMAPSTLTGWTPLISKTFFNEQLVSYNTTPNSKLFNGVLSNHQHLQNGSAEIDYSSGLNLTPFLTHNINILNNNGNMSASQLNTNAITPFHDRTMHLTDFFTDSPIKQTPIKDLDTITPSKFKIGSERKHFKQSIFQDPKSALKRSITQIDTPPRQPHKLSITTKAAVNEGDNSDGLNEDKEDDEGHEHDNSSRLKYNFNLQTPSKKIVLRDITNATAYPTAKTPVKSGPLQSILELKKTQFETPAKPPQVSSPSTVIMSSAVKSTEKHHSESSRTNVPPPSPTPKKESSLPLGSMKDNADAKPAMGLFSERKTKPTKHRPATFKNLSTTADHNSRTTNPNGLSLTNKKNNKAQMQAGMNKFQIVFTDMHTLMNTKSKNKSKGSSKVNEKQAENNYASSQQHLTAPQNPNLPVLSTFSYPSSLSQQEFNSTANSSKEFSIISGNNSSVNTSGSNLNMSSTDHTSFELGGLSSTPNGKFFLDKMFDKPSPQSSQAFNGGQYYAIHGLQPQAYGTMAPPRSQHPPSSLQMPPGQHQQPMMMMMMSTPQHQNVLNYGPVVYGSGAEVSPSADTSAMNGGNDAVGNTSLTAFSYNGIHSYSVKDSHSPSNIPAIGVHGGNTAVTPIIYKQKDLTGSGLSNSNSGNSVSEGTDDQESEEGKI